MNAVWGNALYTTTFKLIVRESCIHLEDVVENLLGRGVHWGLKLSNLVLTNNFSVTVSALNTSSTYIYSCHPDAGK